MRISLALVFLALALVGCKKEAAAPSCSDRVKAYDDALASPAAGNCATDADCKCFNGGVSEKHGCGGVTDVKTNEKLASLTADYTQASCKSGINCAASVCNPACRAGKCTNAPVPGSCDARMDEIDQLLASASKKCTTDKDCACFQGSISKIDRCGGITDAKTKEKFDALAKQLLAAGCKQENVMCPAMVCEPTCNAGTCGPRQVVQ